MKLAFVIHNEHYTERVMGLLASCDIDYYTRWEHAKGKGHETETSGHSVVSLRINHRITKCPVNTETTA